MPECGQKGLFGQAEETVHLRTDGLPVQHLVQCILNLTVGVYVLQQSGIERPLYLLISQHLLDQG